MTICLETTIQRWNGPDGDYLNITDAPEGSTYHVVDGVDAGKKMMFHDGGWIEDRRSIYAIQQAAI